jgi:hypothetical protein
MEKTLQQNIYIFYLYRFLSRFYMYMPLFIVVLIHFKLSYMQMSVVIAIHGLSIMLFKLPLKMILTVVVSKKIILFGGEIIKGIGLIGMVVSQGRLEWLISAQVINGIGFALTTSVESSLLYASMQYYDVKANFRQVEARSQGFSFVSVSIAGVIGSFIADIDLMLPIYISAIFSFLSSINILFFSEMLSNKPVIDKKTHTTETTLASSMRKVYPILLYYAFNRAVILTVFVFLFPIFLLQVFKIDIVFFGMILGIFSMTAYIVGHNIERLSKFLIATKLSLWPIVPFFLLLSVFFLISKNIYLLFAVPVLLGFSGICVRPLSVDRVNLLITENRSLVMSRGEQFFGFLNALFVLILGFLLTYSSLMITLYVFCGIILAGMLLVCVYFQTKYTHYDRIDESPVSPSGSSEY